MHRLISNGEHNIVGPHKEGAVAAFQLNNSRLSHRSYKYSFCNSRTESNKNVTHYVQNDLSVHQ